MALPRYSALLVGSPQNRTWLRSLLPEGAVVIETDVAQAAARLSTVTFDLVLADDADQETLIALEHMLAWKREYQRVPRFYFVKQGLPAPSLSRHVFVLEKPVNEALIALCVGRLLERFELGHRPVAEQVA